MFCKAGNTTSLSSHLPPQELPQMHLGRPHTLEIHFLPVPQQNLTPLVPWVHPWDTTSCLARRLHQRLSPVAQNHMGKATACQLPPHRRHVHPSEHHPEHQERAQLKQLTSRCSRSLWSSCCFCLRQRRARGSCSGSRCCPQEGTTARLSKQRDSKSLQS